MKEIISNGLQPGTVLRSRYRMEMILGSGGFGITYLARDITSGKRLAIKEFFPKQCLVRDGRCGTVRVISEKKEYAEHLYRRFIEEARNLHQLRSIAYMLQVYDVFAENGTAYIVMEYLEGTDLSRELEKNGALPLEQLLRLLDMVLTTMEGIHKKGLIHRDVSPDNIFLLADGSVKLIDYGSLRTYNTDNRLTTILKHSFAPYEQYRSNGNQGPWTDIYALSVTAYYALTGILPPKSPERMISDSTAGLESIRTDIPVHIARAISKGMAVKIEDRFQSAAEMRYELFVRSSEFFMLGTAGYYKNKRLRLVPEQELTLGRARESGLVYPADTLGVSRKQCSIMVDRSGQLLLRDNGSTYGTRVDGMQIARGVWIPIRKDSQIAFGNESFRVGVVEAYRQ